MMIKKRKTNKQPSSPLYLQIRPCQKQRPHFIIFKKKKKKRQEKKKNTPAGSVEVRSFSRALPDTTRQLHMLSCVVFSFPLSSPPPLSVRARRDYGLIAVKEGGKNHRPLFFFEMCGRFFFFFSCSSDSANCL